jgi:hypothetical protein
MIAGFRFDSPFGADLKRVLRHGIGIHHAGLLPKYRRLIERLAQQGLLTVICGTDTLGVGVNVPIRTVCFTKLCKFDGQETKRLAVRDFKQIAGRAGRKGFDTQGTVVCQAPEYVIENRILDAKAAAKPGKSKQVRKKPPDRGYVHWDEGIFRQLTERPPEPLTSQFKVTHGMMLSLMRSHAQRHHGGYGALMHLVADCHERPVIKGRLKRESKQLFQSLRDAAVLEVWPKVAGRGCEVKVSEELQREFTLHQSLSLYLVETLPLIAEQSTSYALDVVSLVEAIAEHPRVVLFAQERRAKAGELIAADLVVWTAGVKGAPWLAQLDGLEVNRANQLLVDHTLRTSRDPRVFALGDCAACPRPGHERPVPPRAQAAHQQALFLARALSRELAGRKPQRFVYKDYGSLISLSSSTIGNLMGNLFKSVTIEGRLARLAYLSLYKKHQVALHGLGTVTLGVLGSLLSWRSRPHLKLH